MEGKDTRTKRPRDRRQQLADVASDLFRTRGYDGVGINDIAAAAGVTGPALYRHFTDKRAILGHVIVSGLDTLESATDAALATTEVPTPEQIRSLLHRLAGHAVERREVAALWRWEGRHLDPDSQRAVRHRSTAMLASWAKVLMCLRTELSAEDAELLCWAGLSVFGSVSVHRTSLGKRRFTTLLTDTALRVLHTELPAREAPTTPNEQSAPETPALDIGRPSRREQLLTAAAELFHHHGFSAVSMERIGQAVGITGPSVYRHFPSKASLFGAIGRRAADRLSWAAEYALRTSAPPDEHHALARLVESYVDILTGPPELLVSFSIDRVHIEEPDRTELLRMQRDYVRQWTQLLEAAHPERETREARILTHAALTIANDLTRTRRIASRPHLRAELIACMTAVLDLP